QAVARSSSFLLDGTSTSPSYPLSLHDALPISPNVGPRCWNRGVGLVAQIGPRRTTPVDDFDQTIERGNGGIPDLHAAGAPLRRKDRKSTRLNSSHVKSSYAVFCLKKKTQLLQP